MTVVRSPGLRALTAAAAVLVHAGAQAALIGVAPRLLLDAAAIASPFVAAATPSAAWAAARQRPWRTAIRLIATAAAVASGSVVAMLLGLLAPGPLGAAVAWTVIGAGSAVIIGVWARWAHPVPSPDRAQP